MAMSKERSVIRWVTVNGRHVALNSNGENVTKYQQYSQESKKENIKSNNDTLKNIQESLKKIKKNETSI